jgi:hypothetical protein
VFNEDRDYFVPKNSAIEYLKYGAREFGKNEPIETLLDGSVGSFAEDRVENTIEECLKDGLYKLSFEETLRLLSLVKCPLCYVIECECVTGYYDEDS